MRYAPPVDRLRAVIDRLTDRVIAAQPLTRAIVESRNSARRKMTEKLPNLGGIASAIDKLTSAIEDDAKKVLGRVEAVHAKRERVFTKANERLAARDSSLDAADAALDKLDAALGDNGGPTS